MSTDANELLLFIENDGDLYRQQAVYIMRAIAKRMLKGTYDPTLAVKAWRHLADAGAQKYTKEFGTPGPNGSFGTFTPAMRQEVARDMAESFERAIKGGEHDLQALAKRG